MATTCSCEWKAKEWVHDSYCRWTHCRMCSWHHPLDLDTDAGFDEFTEHFAHCRGRQRHASVENWFKNNISFGASVQDIVSLFPERGPFNEKHCPTAYEVENYHCIYLWLPLSKLRELFPSLPYEWSNSEDSCCFYFEQGFGLRMISFEFHEDALPGELPALLAYFAWLFQLPLDDNLEGRRRIEDGSCIVSLGMSRKQESKHHYDNQMLTTLEFVDPRNPPQNGRNYTCPEASDLND
ncbi:hypothetical protein THRCLA_21944 [Thraustotheca clavata]|uniref:Uncharacterized protein n=1 Tax=Thraustotheca clavata TaxID=74557 RepID=A0A1V9ZHA8_9STRA|nr:hypothetical protein THRCLA_21944 [Thraustotheca clavata]